MPHYHALGQLPPKRHTRLSREPSHSFLGEGIAYEHVMTTAGFNLAYSILYHLRPPTRVVRSERVNRSALEPVAGQPLQHHHLKTDTMPRGGDPITGRVPLLFNEDVVCHRCRPAEAQQTLYRNGAADEVIFVHQGSGVLESLYGRLPYRELDYIVVPRSVTYRLLPDDAAKEDHLIIESFSDVRLPPRYLNADGQIQLGAPYYHRDFHPPRELITIDREEKTEIRVKDRERVTRVVMAHHPFDVIGWDGCLFPYTFNAMDFEPLTGTVHLPPPFQQTFECRGFVICTFAPRHLDNHPQAIKVPYVHSNVEADEVLFYSRGNFGSRRGVESASITLHPGGIPHGPHPGTIAASMQARHTNELAVMFDTEKPLHVTKHAMELNDPQYPLSWME
ncbi:MAG: homogentisate 1,2-dioxygenase domain-containing protein [Phycisphaeraceae bacterium]